MTTEELLIERYKVIAPYPHSPYKVGDIIKPNNGRFVLTQTSHRDEWGETVRTEHLHKIEVAKEYGNLFEPLPWWKDRKVEDMPQFVRSIKQEYEYGVEVGRVVKVKEWVLISETMYVIQSKTREYHPSCFLPATKEEYEAYLKTTNQLKDGQ